MLQPLEEYKNGMKNGRVGRRYDAYIPWLKVRNVSSCAVKSRIYSLKYNRIFHFLSHGEVLAFYQYEWDDSIIELREQFPLDPEITYQISDELNLLHPGYSHGGNVMTSDFVLTRKGNRIGEELFSAVQVKRDRQSIQDPRTYSKLEIEHQYWARKHIPWKIVLSASFNQIFCKNLEFLYPLRNTHYEPAFLEQLRRRLRPILEQYDARPRDFIDREIKIGSRFIQMVEGINILCAKKYWLFRIKEQLLQQCFMSDFEENPAC